LPVRRSESRRRDCRWSVGVDDDERSVAVDGVQLGFCQGSDVTLAHQIDRKREPEGTIWRVAWIAPARSRG
jgi:hypothetical protein